VPRSNEFDELAHDDILDHVETEINKIRNLSRLPHKFVDRQQPYFRHFATSTRIIRPSLQFKRDVIHHDPTSIQSNRTRPR